MSRHHRNLLTGRLRLTRRQATEVAGVSALLGIILLASILASGAYALGLFANGVVSGNARVIVDSGSSNGKAVQFGSINTGPAPSPAPTPSPVPAPSSTPTHTPAPSDPQAPTPMPVGVSGNWTLTFDDEFNATAVDTTKWTVEGPQAPNNTQEYDCYAPSTVSETGGYLSIALLNQKCTVGGTSYQYTGGQMDTSNHFNQTYGYYEARVYYPGSNGIVDNWGAFWLVNNDWPNDGEIDIGEDYHGSVGYHFEYAPSGSAIWQGGQAPGDWTGWHTYGVNWQADSITYYYDGKEMGSYSTGVSYDNHPMFIELDYSTGPQNDVGGPVAVPTTMQVDYVRAWK